MKWAQTLWDLLARPGSKREEHPRPDHPVAHGRRAVQRPRTPHTSVQAGSMQAKYDAMTQEMLRTHGVRVRRWRTSMSGVAWEVRYRDGTVARLIEAPRPKGPMSAAVFLHEIGHHAIGLGVYRPRCLEEYHAWAFSLSQMETLGLNITDAVRRRMHESLRYSIAKASRRGIRQLPEELSPYTMPWPKGSSRRRAS